MKSDHNGMSLMPRTGHASGSCPILEGPHVASSDEQIALEQRYSDRVYARIDEQIARLETQHSSVIGAQTASTHQNRSERDSFATFYEDRIGLLRSVSSNAIFGRLDRSDASRHYIGRIGVFTAEGTQLLVDWRAPAAAAFYQATPKCPGGVRLRRHLVTSGRTVVDIEDDVLDGSLLDSDEHHSSLQGEGALLAAVSAKRTGRMGDIVATIQAEQDRIIRHETRGALVVQGGPGTGKTAVALHRAAYQLYTHRKRLEHSGVLIVAPTRGFLRYIERVLPSLGETGVVTLTPGELVPGIRADKRDREEVARVKGSLAMTKVLRRAIKARQQIPKAPIDLNIDGVHITLTPKDVRAARAEARATGRPHNLARTTFVRAALERLVETYCAELTRLERPWAEEDRADLLHDLRTNHDVKVALNRCWLPYSPQSFARSFFASKDRLVHAAGEHMSAREAKLLHRSKDAEWTVDDVALLDEIAELLGDDDSAAQREQDKARAAERSNLEYAEKVLSMIDSSEGIVSAAELAAQVGARRDGRSLAEKAAADRAWTYGHIVVDEAQELSPMMWRALMRRNPTKSFTIVGDVAQTSSISGADSWDSALSPFIDDRACIEELTVNYRTPSRIMRHASSLAAAHGLSVTEVRSVRKGEHDVRFIEAPGAGLVEKTLVEARTLADLTRGRVAILCLDDHLDAVLAGASSLFGEAAVGRGSVGIDREVSVMTPTDAKGLEFDAVVIMQPREILESHARGANDLYVALTRPTQALSVVYAGDLPAGLQP